MPFSGDIFGSVPSVFIEDFSLEYTYTHVYYGLLLKQIRTVTLYLYFSLLRSLYQKSRFDEDEDTTAMFSCSVSVKTHSQCRRHTRSYLSSFLIKNLIRIWMENPPLILDKHSVYLFEV